jgi:hypothetical protein
MNDIFCTEKYDINPHNGSGSLIMTKSYLDRKSRNTHRENFLDLPIKSESIRQNPVPRTINYKRSEEPEVILISKPWLIKDPSTITNEETFIFFK